MDMSNTAFASSGRLVRGIQAGSALMVMLALVGTSRALSADDYDTIRGTVRSLTTAPKGETDGAVLDDGTVIHWPPHLENRFTNVVSRGDRVKAIGQMERGKKGEVRFEVLSVTNLRTDKTAENENPPRPDRRIAGRAAGDRDGKVVTARVKSFTTAPKGETDGAVLDDGTVIHWPPHLEDRFKGILSTGDRVKVIGRTETGKKGETRFEVSSLTNLRTDKTAENDTRPRPVVGDKAGPGDREKRLRDLEDRVEDLLKELRQMRREK